VREKRGLGVPKPQQGASAGGVGYRTYIRVGQLEGQEGWGIYALVPIHYCLRADLEL
jgi:hypothetical protein